MLQDVEDLARSADRAAAAAFMTGLCYLGHSCHCKIPLRRSRSTCLANALHGHDLTATGSRLTNHADRATLRLLILRRSSARILTDGGASAEALPDPGAPASTPEAKARAVYSAFARFREKHCLPLIPHYPRPSLDLPPGLLHPAEPGEVGS